MYGRGASAIAEQLNISMQEAKGIIDAFNDAFPKVKEYTDFLQHQAATEGYVQTAYGRKRRLPDMMLPDYEFKVSDPTKLASFDPLDFAGNNSGNGEIPEDRKQYFTQKMNKAWGFSQKAKIKDEAAAEGIQIIDNGGKKADASRQCLNCVDKSTEILTVNGWKKYDEVNPGDEILSFNMNSRKIEKDCILKVHQYDGIMNTIKFQHPSFSAVTTGNHRWPVWRADGKLVFKTSNQLLHRNWPDYHILRCGDNDFTSAEYTDAEIYVIGMFLTDGTLLKQARGYAAELFQSKLPIIAKIGDALSKCNIAYTKRVTANGYCTWYLKQSDWTNHLAKTFPDRILTAEFILSLSQRQAQLLIEAMLDGDGTRDIVRDSVSKRMCCGTDVKADMFQMLCVVAGYGCSKFEEDQVGNIGRSDKVSNLSGRVTIRNKYYIVSVLNRRRVHVYPKRHCTSTVTDGVWCVSTKNQTWIARRDGKVYITGNSVIQGSAADITKRAMIDIYNDEELNALQFKMLIPVHDEIIGECPKENAKRCAERLEEVMINCCKDVIKTPMACDTEICERWYGPSIHLD